MENENLKNYRYYAFISYNHKDMAAAKWLQRKLENYRLPAVLQKQYENAPKKMKIFRDKTDLSAGKTVKDALENELALSKCLVVVCSPHIAYPDTEEKPNWVEREIKAFLSMGHSVEDIFPIIIDGQVKEGAENDCWTSTLYSINKLAADITADGKRDAFIRLVAGLLDIKYDDIKQREKQRLIRKTALLSTIGVLTACLLFATIWFFAPHTKYYADYITRYSLPEGIPELELSRKEIKHLPTHYAITTRWGIFGFGNKPVRLEHRNSFGIIPLPEKTDRPEIATFEYKNNFSLSKDKQKWELFRAKYSFKSKNKVDYSYKNHEIWLEFFRINNEMYIDFYYPSNEKIQQPISNNVLSTTSIFYTDMPSLDISSNQEQLLAGYSPELILFENVSSIFRWQIEYYDTDDKMNGLEKKICFFNKNYQPTSDKNGIKGIDFTYNNHNLIESKTYLYVEGNIAEITSENYEYENLKLKKIYFKNGNEYCNNKNTEFSYLTINYDSKNNSITTKYFDKDGNPAKLSNSDSSYVIVSYDKNGVEISEETETSYCIILESERGLPTKIFDNLKNEDGSLIPSGYMCFKFDFNKNNWQLLQLKQLDKNEVETATGNFYFDEDNNTITEETLLRHENEDQLKDQTIKTYDNYGRLIKQQNVLGLYETILKYSGDNKRLYFVDSYGKPINKSFYEFQNDNSLFETEDFSHADFSYDNDGHIVYAKFKNRDGNNVNSFLLGFSEYTASYNPKGLLIKENFFDANDKPTSDNKYGYASFVAETDLSGSYYVRGAYYDKSGNLIDNEKKGYAYFETETITDKSIIITRFYDSNHQFLTENESKIDMETTMLNSPISDAIKSKLGIDYDYYTVSDSDDKFIASFFNKNDVLVYRVTVINDSYVTEEFDNGQIIEVLYRKETKDGLILKNNNDGFAKKFVYYSEDNSKIEAFFSEDLLMLETKHYDPDGELFAIETNWENGNTKESILFPKESESPFSKAITTYDINGQKLKTEAYNHENVIVMTGIIENNQITYYDTDGNIIGKEDYQ